MSATDGIGRRNSTVEAVTARSNGTLPISTPTATPATIATARPSAQPRRVCASATQQSAVRSWPAERTLQPVSTIVKTFLLTILSTALR
jgi:hypothetical protein